MSDQEEKKTVTEVIQEVIEEICNNYCKYPDIWDDPEQELWDSNICDNCPLNRLG